MIQPFLTTNLGGGMQIIKNTTKYFLLINLFFLLIISNVYADEPFTFDIPNTNSFMSLIGDYFYIDGEPAEIDDQIAVFDQEGTLCALFEGSVVSDGTPHGFFNFTVYGDDPSTPLIEGASITEELSFIVYDASNQLRIPLDNSMMNPKSPWGLYTPIDSVPPTFKGDNENYGLEIDAQSADPAPNILEVSPHIVFLSVGGTLSITGTDFQETVSVTIDGITANIHSFSETLITCEIPPRNEIGTVEVMVTNPDGLTSSTNLIYEYDPPTILEIQPAEVPSEGLTVTIMGDYFRENPTLTVNGKSANATFISETTIQCYIAPYTESFDDTTVDVILQNDDGKQDTSTIKYVFIPKIDSIDPQETTTLGGGQLTILGSHFQETATVLIDNSEPDNISVISNTEITCDIPPHDFGVVNVVVTNPNGYSSTQPFTYDYPEPTITSITPQTVMNTGGEEITIIGTFFELSATVTIGGITVESTQDSVTKIVCQALPYTISENRTFENVDIIINNPNGKFIDDHLRYEYNPPDISHVSMATGTSDSLTFTIYGDYFRSGTTVNVGGIGVDDKQISANSITCHLTVYEEDILNITVFNNDMKSYNKEFPLLFNPYIHSISPQRVHITGNIPITITGAHFEQGLTLTIADETITPTTVTDNQIEFVAPPNDTDTIASVDISITNPAGGEVMKAGALTYKTLIANFNIISDQIGNAPFIVVLEDASIGEEIDERFWHFGDGETEWRDVADIINHEYTAPGTYPITLQVISENGEDTSEVVYIDVEHYDVDIDFYTTSRLDGQPPLSVKFFSEAINAESLAITWTWNFGDDTSSDAASPEHTYTEVGTYTVSLTAQVEGIDEPISVTKIGLINVVERQVNGRIVDSDGNGIPNCEVLLIVPGKAPIDPQMTDQDGYYTFTKLPPEDHIHLAVHPGPETPFFPTHTEEPLSTMSGDTENLVLTLYKGTMVGRIIRDGDEGEGISGVEIALFNDDDEVGHCVSNAVGEYSLTNLPEGEYRLSAWFEKTGTELYYNENGMTSNFSESQMITITDTNNKENPLEIDLVLATGESISGKVVNFDGEPVENIHVNAWSEGLMIGGNATTNAQGQYTITGLTAVESESNTEDKYIVEIHPDGFPYQAYNNQNNPENADLIMAPNTDINFTIASGLMMRGSVTVETGSPENIEVVAKSNKENFEHFTLTDASGDYTLTGLVPANDYIVFAHAPDYPVQFFNGVQNIDNATKIDLSYDNADDVDFAMNKENLIKGEVSGGSFDPSTDVIWVHVSSNSTGTGGDVPTDQDGRYEVVGLDPNADDYIIFIIDPEFGQAYYKDSETTVYSFRDLTMVNGVAQGVSPSETDRDIVLQSNFYSVKGKVMINGQPVSGIQVEAWSESKGHWKSCLSSSHMDSDGANYELTGLIDDATYEINIISDKYILDAPKMITITGDNISDVDLTLINPNRSISGTITGLPDGNKAWVSAFSETADFVEEVMLEGVVGVDMHYMISGLKPAEDYVVHFHALNHPDILYNAKTSWFKANRVNVMNGNKTGIDFTLSSDLENISGKITVPNDAEIGEEIWIDAFSESLDSSNATMVKVTQTCTNEDGCDYEYTIKGLKKGDDYIVVVNSVKYATLFYDSQTNPENATRVDNTSGDPGNINFTLEKGYFIDGFVKDSNGDGISNIEVEAWSDSTNSWGVVSTGLDGSFIIEGLNSASDFKVMALKTNEPPFIYKEGSNHTRDMDFATNVTSVSEGSTSVNIVIGTSYQISGNVQDEYGKGIQGMVVVASAQTQNMDSHSRTDSSGSFIIKGLPGNSTYNISVEPAPTNAYIKQEKSVTIDDSNIKVDFTLTKGYQVSGVVRNASNVPIAEAGVFLRSEATKYDEWVATNADGEYEFKGVPSGTDYDFMVETDEDYLIFTKNDVGITSDLMNYNIPLETAAGDIRGYVYNDDGSTAIANVMIHVFSDNQDVQRFDVKTNYKGYYEINGLPNADDYEIIAIPASGSSYASDSVTGKSPGDVVNFTLSSGGKISGVVQATAGTKLEDVLVSLSSDSLNVNNELTRTDSDGNYSFEALKISSSSDYVVTVYPTDYGYPVSERTGININDTVIFNLTKGAQTTISGTLTYTGNTEQVMVKVYNSTTYAAEGQTFINSGSGSFEVNSLKADTQYVLHFITRDGSLNHFVSEFSTLITSYDGTTFKTGDVINVVFEETK